MRTLSGGPHARLIAEEIKEHREVKELPKYSQRGSCRAGIRICVVWLESMLLTVTLTSFKNSPFRFLAEPQFLNL